ncbi:1-phosphofructokinase family hexose kinase [Agromyces aerolatus]|uniref:1-phosphofructokinase family hexose kinase n=1 Tax=Agromyces sp. LY-1074 TaxID=3074080 RepID=UPI0028666A3A|nr:MULTISPECIES: PfkB family carbohydrate kinase [unclassified Agromyces]MDR5699791.1 PfkB family carbohydrate kinase [Agromyces sp. LY-1074]MDR5706087.1 PfkB family carbohydrate kinase [Agromyces sp. LY-1358]
MAHVVIFAPSPLVTVTIEDDADGPDLHVHAGGQGVWQARMLRTLGAEVTLCATLTGELGEIAGHILEDDGIRVAAIRRGGRGAGYVHDRRTGERTSILEQEGDALSRHDLDDLYALTLREAMAADLVLLSGPADDATLPDDVYRRLASDVRAAGGRVIVDLAGSRLDAAVEGGVLLAKASDEELLESGHAADASVEAFIDAARVLRDAGAEHVLVTRADHPSLLVTSEGAFSIHVPRMEAVDARGAGDSFTAATTAALLDGDEVADAVQLGAAAAALNVTRHGLASGDAEAIRRLRAEVGIEPVRGDGAGQVSPAELAGRVEEVNP